ncbi:MAG: hypothetical protein JO201_05200 [Verrucomicrobia bacterium]|nr:hypothetical protein [Verrucomicrobiota bacterium]
MLLFAIVCFVAVVLLIVAAANPAVTRYVENPRFRTIVEQETAKGLHFPDAKFAPIQRAGLLSARTENFQARNGWKAMTSLDANKISARFNPFGVLLRRWQVDDLRIDRAKIGIHVYEPKPEPTPSKPWYHIFLPDRVYLKRVWSDDVDVTWPMRRETGGIFGTRLTVTPHGRDFEYHATGGTMRNPSIPDLAVERTHLLITKKIFTLYMLDLHCGDGDIHSKGSTAIGGEKAANFSFKWNAVPIIEWLPRGWRYNFAGTASGDAQWTGNDYKLSTATIAGNIHIIRGQIHNSKFLDQIAAITNRSDLAQLELDECRSKFRWQEGGCELSEIAIEQNKKFRIEGSLSLSGKSLGGMLQIGLAPECLAWLPNPEEIFSRRSGSYLWITIHLSGTLDSPKHDLSPRLLGALKESPGALLGAALRALSTWLDSESNN